MRGARLARGQRRRDEGLWHRLGAIEPRALAGLPALARAQKLGDKAGRVGFDWGGWQGSLAWCQPISARAAG